MNVSYNWLSKLVDLEGLTPETVAEKLTFAGAEVEGISHLASGTNLVIGEIISCIDHPDSDHLHVLQVDEGKYGVNHIVCGAPNARKGLKVIVARPGAKLPEVEIKPSKIRGQESNGMCCSLLELGVEKKMLSEYQLAGIEELPADAPVGEENVLGYLGLDDCVLEVSVLPNRPDLNAMENVAREVSCLFSRELRLGAIKEENLKEESFLVDSATPKCPQFSARVYRGVKNGPSPLWLKRVLNAEGVRSIDKIVDIGNYIMLLTGQPLNMYDEDKLAKKELVVVDDYEGKFLAMDGNEYELTKGDLLVTSGKRPVCLAGIMTADAARIDENTKNIVVEAANFDYASIRHTSNRLGLSSDSSSRFCKGINPHQAEYVQALTGMLLKELCDYEIGTTTSNYDTLSHERKVVEVTLDYLNKRLGTAFLEEEVISCLTRDHMVYLGKDKDCLRFEIPAHRIDIEGKADLSEELIRLEGYDKVQSTLPFVELSCTGLTPSQKKQRDLRHYLLHCGISEILTYTLISKDAFSRFALLHKEEPYVLSNPLTTDREIVRTSLMESALQVASYNKNHQNKDLALFEISDVDGINLSSRDLVIVLTGNVFEQGSMKSHPADFYDVKGLYEGILSILNVNPNRVQIRRFEERNEELHPGKSVGVYLGKKLIGYFGELHPVALDRLGLDNAAVLELDVNELYELRTSEIKAKAPSRFPTVSRDLAFLVDKKVSFSDIEREALRADPLIKKVVPFDLYEGKGIPEGKKSLAISITLGSNERTLKEEEITLATKKVMDTLSRKFLAEIRG
ncbi:MAG: phenylalanine--tRNA ligase subunit beta [Bacilli bacterium]|nr:phenylalanine--tRNA ligase subunit beta [Bacilli bacterium]